MAQYIVELTSTIGFKYEVEADSEEQAIYNARLELYIQSADEDQTDGWLSAIVRNSKKASVSKVE